MLIFIRPGDGPAGAVKLSHSLRKIARTKHFNHLAGTLS
jgi:hypothetical protein